jgi:hypothetical protein
MPPGQSPEESSAIYLYRDKTKRKDFRSLVLTSTLDVAR